MESPMRTRCLGLLVLLLTGALGVDARAQSVAVEPLAAPTGPPKPVVTGTAPVMPGADAPGGKGQAPSGQAGIGDGSCQGQQQPTQHQQTAGPGAQRQAELDALRRDQYGPPEGMWFSAGPLVWWLKQAPASGPLVTAGTTAGQGILGQADTRTLFGT